MHINSSKYVAKDVHEVLKKFRLLPKKKYEYKKLLLFVTGGSQWIDYVERIRKLVFSSSIPIKNIQIRK